MFNSSPSEFDCIYNTTNIDPLEEVLNQINLHYVLRGPALTLVIVLGLLGNLLSLNVFFNLNMRLKICNYLITLEIWNSILLLGSMFLYSLPMMLSGRYVISGQYVVVYPPLYTITNVAYVGSIWSVVLLSAERYFALCKPLKHMKWDTERRTKTMLTLSTVLVVLYQSPRYFEFHLLNCFDFAANKLVTVLDASSLHTSSVYIIFYKIIAGLLFLSFGPFVCLTVFCIIVWWQSKKMETVRRRMSTEPLLTNRIQRRNRQMDRIMFTVIVKFCICHALPSVLDVCEIMLDTNTFTTYVVDTYISDITNLLVCVNSSCDFVIYYFCSQSFRYKILTNVCLISDRRPRSNVIESSDRGSSL